MEFVYEFFRDHFAGTAFYILVGTCCVLAIYKDWNSVLGLLKTLWQGKNFFIKRFYTIKRNWYDKALISDDFISWQLAAMKIIYGDLIHKLDCKEVNIELAQLSIGTLLQEYEAIVIRVKEQEYPFDEICPKSKLEVRKDIFQPYYKYDEYNEYQNKIIKQYYRMIKYQIRYPKRLGYMLKDIDFHGDTCTFSSYTGCYKDNVLQSHVLEYELYKTYKRYYKKKWEKNNLLELDKDKLLGKMKLRKALHDQFKEEKEEKILISGHYRSFLEAWFESIRRFKSVELYKCGTF